MIRLLTPVLLLCLAACATPDGATPDSASKVTIHESVTDAPPRFEIIKRLWTESGRSFLFWVPTYDSQEEAMAAFRSEAESLGGNGVINFGCYNAVISPKPPAGSPLYCNGTIVKFY